jgi:hypothetical protein
LAVSTWRPDEEKPVLRKLRQVAERHVGAIEDRRHGFGEAAPLEALLRGAGFGDVRVRVVSRTMRFEDGSVFARFNAMAMVGMSPSAKEMREAERAEVMAAILRESVDVVQPHTDAAGFTYEIRANVATAVG